MSEDKKDTRLNSKKNEDNNVIFLNTTTQYLAARMDRLLTITEGMIQSLIPFRNVPGVEAVMEALNKVQEDLYVEFDQNNNFL